MKFRRVGYTLLEMTLAMTAASVLMVGLTSTLFIAFNATDTSSGTTAAMIEADTALTGLLAELEFAQSITERTATAITFTVPDRDGDSLAETIRYAWSGTPGDPITRQYNGGSAITLVEDVHVFQHDLPPLPPNLLSNADMESGTTNWQAIPNAAMYSDGTAYTGTKSLYSYRLSGNDESGLRQDVTMLVTNGTSYTVQGWLYKWAAAAPFDTAIQLRVTSTGSGEQLFSTDPVNINNTTWTQIQDTLTPTWTGTLVSAYWEATGLSSIQEIYLDDVYMGVKSPHDQYINVSVQVGSDGNGLLQSGAILVNAPL